MYHEKTASIRQRYEPDFMRGCQSETVSYNYPQVALRKTCGNGGSQAEQIRNTLSADRFSRNANISDSLLIESNEKVVNAIYYSTIGAGGDSLSPTQLQAITEIAYQCPATGGKGVYKARALYRMLYGFVFFDDVGVCATQGVSWRKPKTMPLASTPNALKISPNPTKGEFTLDIPKLSSIEGNISVYTLLGDRVCYFPVHEGQLTYTINCEGWSAGIYSVRLENNHEKQMARLVILP